MSKGEQMWTCHEVRRAAYDFRTYFSPSGDVKLADEFSELESLSIQTHLADCAYCQAYLHRLNQLLESPARVESEFVASFDPNTLFDRVMAEATEGASNAGALSSDAFSTSASSKRVAKTEDELGKGGFERDHSQIQRSYVSHPYVGKPCESEAAKSSSKAKSIPPQSAGLGGRSKWIAAAALLALAWGAFYLINLQTSAEHSVEEAGQPTTFVSNSPSDKDVLSQSRPGSSNTSKALASAEVHPSDEVTEKVLSELSPAEVEHPSVKIFASPQAVWELSGRENLTLSLQTGVLLVEFIPGLSAKSLRVKAPHYKAEVIGTVFYAKATDDSGQVGVLTGAVRVQMQGHENSVELASGEVYELGQAVREITGSQRRATSRHVDLVAHLEALARLDTPRADIKPTALQKAKLRKSEVRRTLAPRQASSKPERSSNRQNSFPNPTPAALERAVLNPGPEIGQMQKTSMRSAESSRIKAGGPERVQHRVSEVTELQMLARKGMSSGDYRQAAEAYEKLLRLVAPGDRRAAAIQLDLSRIYLQHLAKPGRAAFHLRDFVRHWPEDVATPSAKKQLCRALATLGERDPLCSDE